MSNLAKTRMLAMITNEITQVNMRIRNLESCLPCSSSSCTFWDIAITHKEAALTDIIVELTEYRNMLLRIRKQIKEGAFSLC